MVKKEDTFNFDQKILFIITLAAGFFPYLFRALYYLICKQGFEGTINELDLLLFSVTLTIACYVDSENMKNGSIGEKKLIRTGLIVFLFILGLLLVFSIVIESDKIKIASDNLSLLNLENSDLKICRFDRIKDFDDRISENGSIKRANEDGKLIVFFISILMSIISIYFSKKIILRKAK